MTEKAAVSELLEWGAAVKAYGQGEDCGDRCLVQTFPGGVLVAVVDGLGHGRQAAAAAAAATRLLGQYAEESVIPLMVRLDAALAATRGAVVGLAAFHEADQTMTWIAVGNITGLLLRPPNYARRYADYLFQCRGVVGFQLPTLRASVVSVSTGDTLIFATDGIAAGFEERLPLYRAPQQIADQILARHALGTDDALALVARWRGRNP